MNPSGLGLSRSYASDNLSFLAKFVKLQSKVPVDSPAAA